MSTITSTQFESLCNEILLDIFEYLDAYRMCQAFHGLNSRINSLLRLARLHISHDLSTVADTIWDTVLSFPQLSQMHILSFSYTTTLDRRILQSSMENLRTISFHSVCLKSIDDICERIPCENQIKCLSAFERSSEWYDGTAGSLAHLLLINHSHRFFSLKSLSLSIPWCRKFPVVFVTFHQLHYLALTNFYFSTDLLEFLRNRTPNLRSLKFAGKCCLIQPSSMIVGHVYELHIDNQIDSSRLEGILSNFPSLRRLHIQSQNNRQPTASLNSSICQQLIEQYCPNVNQLTILLNSPAYDSIFDTSTIV